MLSHEIISCDVPFLARKGVLVKGRFYDVGGGHLIVLCDDGSEPGLTNIVEYAATAAAEMVTTPPSAIVFFQESFGAKRLEKVTLQWDEEEHHFRFPVWQQLSRKDAEAFTSMASMAGENRSWV